MMRMEKLCHCGKPLHYPSKVVKELVEAVVESFGEYVTVTVQGKRYKVPRHYIMVHGIIANVVPLLGFEELSNEPPDDQPNIVVVL
jgi:hypothetical protein